jgi:hypothetical protein
MATKIGKLDLSGISVELVGESDNGLEVQVTTIRGTTRITMDFTQHESVGLKAVLPSGNTYTAAIDSWTGGQPDLQTEDGRASILRLVAGMVTQCFEKERLQQP